MSALPSTCLKPKPCGCKLGFMSDLQKWRCPSHSSAKENGLSGKTVANGKLSGCPIVNCRWSDGSEGSRAWWRLNCGFGHPQPDQPLLVSLATQPSNSLSTGQKFSTRINPITSSDPGNKDRQVTMPESRSDKVGTKSPCE